MQKPVFVLAVKFFVSRSEGSHPNAGAESESANVLRELLHSLWELILVCFEIHVVEFRYGQLVGIALPRFDRPYFAAERLKKFFADARLGEVVFGGGLVEISVPRHPARRSFWTAFFVERLVIGNVSIFQEVFLDIENEVGFCGL